MNKHNPILERDAKGRIVKGTGGRPKGSKGKPQLNKGRMQELIDHMFEDKQNGIFPRLEKLEDKEYLAFWLKLNEYVTPKAPKILMDPDEEEKKQMLLIVEDVRADFEEVPNVPDKKD